MFYTYLHRKPSGEIFYVGKGSSERAWDAKGRNIYWQRIADKYGYKVDILSFWESESDAFEHEKVLISCFKDMGINLANLTNGGEGSFGYKWTDEQKEKFDISGDRNGMFGKTHSEETRRLISLKATGRSLSKETREKLSMISRGRAVSEETRQKLRDSSSNKKHTYETRKKISLARTGLKLTDEHRAKIGNSLRGRKHSSKTIEKMKQAAILRHQKRMGNCK